jgi:hypothetical protein
MRTLALAGMLLSASAALALPARADDAAPGPSPSPAAAPVPGTVRWSLAAHASFISQSVVGPGLVTLEGPGFAAGAPLAPLTPYDTFSSAPLVPGNALESALVVTPTWYGRGFDASLGLGLGFVTGSMTAASYWGESLLPPNLNPHLGSQLLPVRIVFPTHPGSDDATGVLGSVTNATIASKDGGLRLRGGWFDLAQSDGFVFVQPSLVSVNPAIGFVPPESLGDGPPSADWWNASGTRYPLHGVDLVARRGAVTVELSDAALPSLPGTGARLTMGSLVLDRGEGTRFSLQALHVATGGAPVATTVLFGIGGIVPSPQGPLPSTTIGGQSETIVGGRAALRLGPVLSGTVEIARSNYTADGVAAPGTGRPGSYLHAGLAAGSKRAQLAFDFYRNDPYYATAILPYGVPENVWAVAWSWPGQWLKSNYQLIDNAPVNVDRQGYRMKAAVTGGTVELRAAYANFGQIVPIAASNAVQTGFVDGFFLPQTDAAATLGRQKQYGLWTTWHAPFADVFVDYTEDTMRRAAFPTHPEDHVSYDTPQFAVYASRRVGATLVAAGFGRYGMRGSFGQAYTNVDFGQRTWFAGAQLPERNGLATLISVRRTNFGGIPSQLPGPSPDFRAWTVIFEQRLQR